MKDENDFLCTLMDKTPKFTIPYRSDWPFDIFKKIYKIGVSV